MGDYEDDRQGRASDAAPPERIVAQPPPPPPGQSSMPPPPQTASQTPSELDRALPWIGLVLVVLSALVALFSSGDRGLSYRIGSAIGAAILPLVIYGGIRLFAARRVARIAGCVIAGLLLLVALVTSTQQRAASDDFYTSSELACFEAKGFDQDERESFRRAVNRPLAEASASLEPLMTCAPRIAMGSGAVQGFQASASRELGVDVSDAEAQCALVAIFEQPDISVALADQTAMGQVLRDCLTPETFEQIQSAAVERELNRMATWCQDGNDAACDQLFAVAPLESSQRAVGETCGGRELQSPTFCLADMIDRNADGLAETDSPGVTNLANDCIDGSMIVCDALSTIVDRNSEPFQIGLSCGDRRPRSDNFLDAAWCVDFFGETAS